MTCKVCKIPQNPMTLGPRRRCIDANNLSSAIVKNIIIKIKIIVVIKILIIIVINKVTLTCTKILSLKA